MKEAMLIAAVAAGFAFSGTAVRAGEVPDDTLSGAKAFGSWEQAKPGVTRLIKPSDLPPPFNTKSASNAPGQADKPADAKPLVPAGFAVSEFATGFTQPRVIEIAPNGAVFVADSDAGQIDVLRMAEDGTRRQGCLRERPRPALRNRLLSAGQ